METKDKKSVKKKEPKKKKEKIGFRKTVANNLFALRAIAAAAPLYLFIYLGSSLLYGTFDFLTGNFLLRRIVNGVSGGESVESVIRYVLILAALMIPLYTLSGWYFQVIASAERQKVGAYVERQLFVKSTSVELACYENPKFYDKYVKAMDEAYGRIMQVMYTLDNLIWRVIALAANSLLLFVIDPWLILFGLFPLVLGIFRRLENIAWHDNSDAQKPITRRVNYVQRTFYLGDYAKEMRIGGMYANMFRDLRATYAEYKAVQKKYGRRAALFSFIREIGIEVITVLGATLYAVYKTMHLGTMNVGDCIVVLGSISTISYALSNLIQNFAEFGEHALFLNDVRYFLDYEPKIKGGGKLAEGGTLKLENVSFRYEGAESDTLKNISFEWKRGERIALVGANGSGKTTLAKLLLRLYDPTEGEITMGGENIKEFTLESYRESFGTVFQDYKMFSMTVAENVLLRPVTKEDYPIVEEALKESGAYKKISSFERGLDTILTREFDDKGENLSGGEAQKLSLARIFADKTPYVILDEPSSALDPIAEYTMFENMMRATEGRSVIFISHRLSSAVLADKVVLMEGGGVAECGTHTELMKNGGKYAKMFNRQAQNYLGSEVSANG